MMRNAGRALVLGLVVALATGVFWGSRAAGGPAGGTLTIARATDSVSLDPNLESASPGVWVYSNLFETLVRLTQEMKVEPALATAWEIKGSTRIQFKLRRGVKFHDGSPFNAQAVKFSFDRMMNPARPGAGASNLGPVDRVDIVDDYTVDIVTLVPYAPLLLSLTLVNSLPIVSPEGVRGAGDGFGRNPSGTGPFKFQEWLTNNRIVLVRNDDYWGPKPPLERVVFRVIPEDSARILALETGEVDMVLNPVAAGLRRLRGNPKYQIAEVGGLRTLFYGFNVNLPPVNDVKVRQAISSGIDRKAIIDNVMEGIVEPAVSVISPRVFGASDTTRLWGYNRQRAEQLLDEAGWERGPDGMRTKGGQKLTVRLYAPRGRWPKDAETAEAVQAQMRALGVDLQVQVLEWTVYFTGIRRHSHTDAHMLALGWSTVSGDADYALRPLFSCGWEPPKGWNSYNYCNRQYDELILRAMGSLDPEQRKRLYAQAQDLLMRDMVGAPMYTYKEIVVLASHVRGYVIHPLDYYMWVNTVRVQR